MTLFHILIGFIIMAMISRVARKFLKIAVVICGVIFVARILGI